MTSSLSFSAVAYPQANPLIPLSYVFEEGQQATINCRVMPGKLSQYYSVRWINDSVTISTSNPRSVLPGYQLHDNFSLTIYNIQLNDSSTSYQCSVTIDDPQRSGTDNVVYDQSYLGLITVIVGESPNKHTFLASFPGFVLQLWIKIVRRPITIHWKRTGG